MSSRHREGILRIWCRRSYWRRLAFGLLAWTSLAAASPGSPSLHYEVHGTGKPIILVHGWTCDSSLWTAQINALRAQYQVVALDLPGHGRSVLENESDIASLDAMVATIEYVRRAIKADDLVVVGHSMGAAVARRYAAAYPDRVAAIIGVDGYMDQRGIRASMPDLAFIGREGRQTRKQLIAHMFTESTSRAVKRQVTRTMLPPTNELATITWRALRIWLDEAEPPLLTPALAIYSTNTPMPEYSAVRLGLPHYEAVSIADSGHFIMIENPKVLNHQILSYLKRIGY